MKAVRIHKYEGGPHDLIYEEDVTQPHAMGGEVLIKVYATGVTRNEIVWIWKNPDLGRFSEKEVGLYLWQVKGYRLVMKTSKHISKKRENHMALTLHGLLCIQVGTNLSK
jgi:hypothetical protein